MTVFGSDRIFVGATIAGSSKDSIFERWELESKHRPRFGRNWWFWVPSITSNGGWAKYQTLDIGLNWLCFAAWVTIDPKKAH
jgi:hypothetical protein